MMIAASVVALALFASSVTAQTSPTSLDNPQSTNITDQLRAYWCIGQRHVCTILCDMSANPNTCSPSTLNYTCLCTSNNSSPDLAAYMNSMPYFICEESYKLCIDNHPSDPEGQKGCQNNIRSKCGTLNVENYTSPASTSSAGPTSATSTASNSGTATAATPSATKSSAAIAAMRVGKEFGSGIIAAGLVAAFGFML